MKPPESPAEAFPSLGAPLDLLRLLWAIDHALQRKSKRMEKTIGITGPQRLVLRIVGKFPGISVGRLARLLDVHPSTVTGLADRLIRRGLLRRRPDPRDARRQLLGLTPAGHALDEDGLVTIESAIETLLKTAPAGQVAAACRTLASLRKLLDEQDPAFA